MNGPARVNNMLVIDDKEIRDENEVPDVMNSKKELRKVIDIIGEMDASYIPAGTLQKDL